MLHKHQRLAAGLVPGELCDGVHDCAEGAKVEEMMCVVDTMLEKSCADDEKVELIRIQQSFTCQHHCQGEAA
ncbi:hypothetical protein INR49_026078 [Caranx melampygus]|nr:hypothetical protein INR49_026078 [Caranx melampygus]